MSSNLRKHLPRVALVRLAAALAALALVSAASAHAHLEESTPAHETVVTTPLSELQLVFSEGVETDFSRFVLVRIDDAVDPEGYGEDGASWTALAEIGQALHDQLVAGGPGADVEGAVELMLASAGAAEDVLLQVEGDLTPGNYLVFYNVLSVDTHSSSGFVVFRYEPTL